MRNLLLLFATVLVLYSCLEISGKERKNESKEEVRASADPLENYRVRKDEAGKMRKKRGSDTSAVKMAIKDIMALTAGSSGTDDSLIFYLVKYDSKEDYERYNRKVPGMDWKSIKGRSSLLVGVKASGRFRQSMLLARPSPYISVSLYDIGVVCPPPANCDCEIE